MRLFCEWHTAADQSNFPLKLPNGVDGCFFQSRGRPSGGKRFENDSFFKRQHTGYGGGLDLDRMQRAFRVSRVDAADAAISPLREGSIG